MSRFERVSAVIGVAAAIATAGVAGGQQTWMSRRAAPPVAAHSRVIAASSLTAPGERGGGSARMFDRLRIPSDTTEIQLSFATDLAAGAADDGVRFVAELTAIDGDDPPKIYETTIEPKRAGAVARVVVPAPPDGDYVLRLRRGDGARMEIVVTRAFRLTRGPQGRVR